MVCFIPTKLIFLITIVNPCNVDTVHMHHHNPLLITNRFWILTINKDIIFWKKNLETQENIQAVGYNGACMLFGIWRVWEVTSLPLVLTVSFAICTLESNFFQGHVKTVIWNERDGTGLRQSFCHLPVSIQSPSNKILRWALFL